jgi:hypothetical protein
MTKPNPNSDPMLPEILGLPRLRTVGRERKMQFLRRNIMRYSGYIFESVQFEVSD